MKNLVCAINLGIALMSLTGSVAAWAVGGHAAGVGKILGARPIAIPANGVESDSNTDKFKEFSDDFVMSHSSHERRDILDNVERKAFIDERLKLFQGFPQEGKTLTVACEESRIVSDYTKNTASTGSYKFVPRIGYPKFYSYSRVFGVENQKLTIKSATTGKRVSHDLDTPSINIEQEQFHFVGVADAPDEIARVNVTEVDFRISNTPQKDMTVHMKQKEFKKLGDKTIKIEREVYCK